jgi:hypothetical protein
MDTFTYAPVTASSRKYSSCTNVTVDALGPAELCTYAVYRQFAVALERKVALLDGLTYPIAQFGFVVTFVFL